MVRKCAPVQREKREEKREKERQDVVPHFAILFAERKRRIAVEARFAVGFARIVKGYA